MVAFGVMSLIWLLVVATPAQADSCPGQYDYGQLTNQWQPSDGDLAGFRSTIVLRTRGSVCSPDGFTADWVGVASQVNSGISQIGWSHYSGRGHCRFWFWDNGTTNSNIQLYDCDDALDGTVILFKVSKWYNSGTGQYYYAPYDCGASWSTCVAQAGGPSESKLGDVYGAVDSEVNYGGTNCLNRMEGSQNYRVRFGEVSTDPIKGQKSYGGAWGVKTLFTSTVGACTGYGGDYVIGEHSDSNMKTYDIRST
jgi:hypothetical protein